VIKSLNRYIISECGVNKLKTEDNYTRIIKQIGVRNAIAHTQSCMEDLNKFFPVEGIILHRNKAIIEDVKYLKDLIQIAQNYFHELFISIDKKLTEIST